MGDCNSNGCKVNNCNCSCHSKEPGHDQKHDEMMEYWLETADQAWTEVLKDKIKEHILATQNDRMTELAKIVSDANNQRWKLKMEKKHGCQNFKDKLSNFFGQKK